MSPLYLQSPYAVVFAVAYLVWAVPELVDSVRRRGDDPGDEFDRGSKYGIYGAVGLLVGVGFAFGSVPAVGFGAATVPAFWAGVALVAAGTGLRWYAVAVLDEYFTRSVAVTSNHTVVERGPYAHVRHPTYTGSLAALVGFGLAFGTWPSLATAVLAGGVAYAYRIRVEERVLRTHLDGYAAYCDRTPHRLVPFVY